MAVQFLSEDWTSAVQEALDNHGGFKSAIANADLSFQFDVSDAPDGDVSFYMKATGGSAEISLGALDEPDVTLGQTYETATGIFGGDLNAQTAFMTGKLKVSGNLAKLMMHQAAIQQWQAAAADIDVDY